ncbi:hypothetical protein AN1V17_14790 [Vallitalea sediminicola]
MSNKNVLIKKRNSNNSDWENIYPVTMAENVKCMDGNSIDTHMADIAYKQATVNGREIQLTVPSFTFTNNKYISVEIIADIPEGTALTLKVNSDTTLNIKDEDNNNITNLDKGFYTYIARTGTPDFFLLAPKGLDKKKEYEYQKLIANQSAVLDIYDRTLGATNVYYDLMDGTNDFSEGKIDNTKTKLTQTINSGTTVLTNKVESTAGFKLGQEITIQDGNSMEDVTITKVNSSELEITPTQNAYKNHAVVYRSNVRVESNKMKIGDYEDIAEYNYTSSYFNLGGVGYNFVSKVQKLSNGWYIYCTHSTNRVTFYVSKDTFKTVQQLCYIAGNISGKGNFIIVNDHVYFFFANASVSASTIYYIAFNPSTIGNGNLYSSYSGSIIANAVKSIKDISLAKNPINTKIAVVFAAYDHQSAHIYNLHSCDFTINTDKSLHNINSYRLIEYVGSSSNQFVPAVMYYNNNDVLVTFSVFNSHVQRGRTVVAKFVKWKYVGGLHGLMENISSIQKDLVLYKKKRGSHIGRYYIFWSGKNATNEQSTLKYSYSDNDGDSWTALAYVVPNSHGVDAYAPNIFEDTTGNLFLTWYGKSSSYYSIYIMKSSTGLFSGLSYSRVVSGTTGNVQFPTFVEGMNTYTSQFPLFSFANYINNTTSLYGKFNDVKALPLTESIARYNITPTTPSNEVITWTTRDNGTDFNIDSELSIVNTCDVENYTPMKKSSTITNTTEDEFIGTGTKGNKITVKYILSRDTTSVNKGISKILGATGE